MVPWIEGTSLMVTSETRHCAPSTAAPSADIRLTARVGGSPGGMSAGAGGGACASESVAIVTERMPSRPAGMKLPRIFLRIASTPCRFSRSPSYGKRRGKPSCVEGERPCRGTLAGALADLADVPEKHVLAKARVDTSFPIRTCANSKEAEH